jgi:hypothetical protein
MRQSTYLNVILTINAALLTGLLWTQFVGAPSLTSQALAQTTPGVGIPNAAEQRQRMIETMREIKASIEVTRKLLESGKVKVEVANIKELREENQP